VTEVHDDPLTVTANGVTIECDQVVIATHLPLLGKSGFLSATLLQSKVVPYSTYVVSGKVPHASFSELTLWDTSEPYYYLRIDRESNQDRVIFGGNDHKTGQEADTGQCLERLEEMLLRILPEARIDRRWSGQVIETHDGLPLIGPSAERQFVATGFAGNGMTFGTLAGLMARDWVLDCENPWQELFSVDRKPFPAGTWEYIKENADYPYYYLKDRMSLRGPRSTQSIGRRSGRVLKLDGQSVACFHDDKGQMHHVSAICTHLGCLVHWNPAEQTWDCPCHGSRFRPDGSVLAGPAETPLAPVRLRQEAASTSPGA
jgi:nitrite reductase/ring-hydroxylating ferredoxin subunit